MKKQLDIGPWDSLFDRRTRLCAMRPHEASRGGQIAFSLVPRTAVGHIIDEHAARLAGVLHNYRASKIFAAEKRAPWANSK